MDSGGCSAGNSDKLMMSDLVHMDMMEDKGDSRWKGKGKQLEGGKGELGWDHLEGSQTEGRETGTHGKGAGTPRNTQEEERDVDQEQVNRDEDQIQVNRETGMAGRRENNPELGTTETTEIPWTN